MWWAHMQGRLLGGKVFGTRTVQLFCSVGQPIHDLYLRLEILTDNPVARPFNSPRKKVGAAYQLKEIDYEKREMTFVDISEGRVKSKRRPMKLLVSVKEGYVLIRGTPWPSDLLFGWPTQPEFDMNRVWWYGCCYDDCIFCEVAAKSRSLKNQMLGELNRMAKYLALEGEGALDASEEEEDDDDDFLPMAGHVKHKQRQQAPPVAIAKPV